MTSLSEARAGHAMPNNVEHGTPTSERNRNRLDSSGDLVRLVPHHDRSEHLHATAARSWADAPPRRMFPASALFRALRLERGRPVDDQPTMSRGFYG
jgi:hypothetical protein